MSAAPEDNRLRAPLAELVAHVGGGWAPVVRAWADGAAGQALLAYVDGRVRGGATVFPAQVFRALELTPRERVRVVLLGQDPYHGAGQAEGLAFSVPPGTRVPPSLRNIHQELQRELGRTLPRLDHLGGWARQGVLLLNTSLTVEEGRAGSHAKRGWEALTDALIAAVAADTSPKVFMLWGAHAQAKKPLVEAAGGRHLVLQSNHPSPLSATRGPVPFVGSAPFGAANRFLEAEGVGPAIDWTAAA